MDNNPDAAPIDSIPTASPPPTSAAPALSWRESVAFKVLTILIVGLVMLIPMNMVSFRIAERQARQEGVLSEFKTSWGPSQLLRGPVLVIPYEIVLDTQPVTKMTRFLHLAPDTLRLDAKLVPETRKRGLFHAVVYSSDVSLTGRFRIGRDALPIQHDANILWSEAFVLMGATDWRGAPSASDLTWGDSKRAFDSQVDSRYPVCPGVDLMAAPIALDPASALENDLPFATKLGLRGTELFGFVPVGRKLDASISAAWPTPSFGGNLLPSSSEISKSEFVAEWHGAGKLSGIPSTWSNYSGQTCAGLDIHNLLATPAALSVELLEAVPTYRMVDRASKYDVLFLALSFLTYFLFEMIGRVRIHIVQYGLLGLSISLFALLLISFSEPLGFAVGYAVSTLAVLAQATIYTASVTRNLRQAGVFAAILSGLFGFLYIVLSLESYSLLAGAVALFAILSVVMVVTRHIDWTRGLGGSVAAKG